MSCCLLHGPSSSTDCSTADCFILSYCANCLLFTITTTVTVTTVTVVTAITAAITNAVTISSLLLAYLLLVGRLDLGHGQRKDAVEPFCRRAEDKVTYVPLGMCFPFFSILLLLFFYLAILL